SGSAACPAHLRGCPPCRWAAWLGWWGGRAAASSVAAATARCPANSPPPESSGLAAALCAQRHPRGCGPAHRLPGAPYR
nr:hypothetical protein [Tanacetum cinerariifolium]